MQGTTVVGHPDIAWRIALRGTIGFLRLGGGTVVKPYHLRLVLQHRGRGDQGQGHSGLHDINHTTTLLLLPENSQRNRRHKEENKVVDTKQHRQGNKCRQSSTLPRCRVGWDVLCLCQDIRVSPRRLLFQSFNKLFGRPTKKGLTNWRHRVEVAAGDGTILGLKVDRGHGVSVGGLCDH